MTELSFAKSFLTTLDSRPTKLSADHVEDPKTYPPRPAYILPKQESRPLAKKAKLTASGAEPAPTITLKSLRNPPIDLTLPSLPLTTSILNLKENLSSHTSIPITKLKLLYNKKPVPDSKILKDLAGDGEVENMEFSVMVIGGAAAIRREGEEEKEPVVAATAAGMGHGKDVLKSEAFWNDLKGFLVQRLKDGGEGERVCGVFKAAIDAEK